jgi:hypothetical protein
MAASDLTTVAFIFKRDYSTRQTQDIAERDHPLFNSITKEDGFVGDAHFYGLKYQNGQGVSGTFANAQANAKAMSGKQWQASRKAKYGVGTLKGEAMAASRTNKGAFLRLVHTETDGVLKEMGDSFAFDLYRDGNGIRGRRASASTNVITLTDAADARNFKVNMTIGASSNSNGSSPRTGTTYVTAVNLKNGTITLNSAAAIASFADNDYLFRDGDPATCMEGLASCTPLTAPVLGSDSFRGIDRGSYPELLAGARIDDTSTSIEENIGLLGVQIGASGQMTREAYANPIKVFQISRRLNAKVMYQDAGGTAKWGFQYIVIETPAGVIKVVSDPDCPNDRFYLVNPESHLLKHLDPLPHIIEDDGRPSLRAASADDIEFRARGWVNYIQDRPGDFGVGSC